MTAWSTPVGPVSAEHDERGRLLSLQFVERADDSFDATRTSRALDAYFAGERDAFAQLELAPVGTEFQHLVWDELLRIPYGVTRAYGQIAEAIGSPGAARAVGMANNANPIAIVVPCHRVIGSDGKLVGYASGIERKCALLEFEQRAQRLFV